MALIRWLPKSSEASSKPDYNPQGYLAFSLKVKKNRSIGYALLHTIYVVFLDVITILGIGFLRAKGGSIPRTYCFSIYLL